MTLRMTTLALLTLSLAAPAAAGAQTADDREGVRRAVLDYVEGFYEGDSTKILRSVSPEMMKYGYYRERPSEPYAGMRMTYDTMRKRTRPMIEPNAPKDVVIFEVQDQTASAKLTAWWGTDYLLLGKESGRWTIRGIIWQGPLKK